MVPLPWGSIPIIVMSGLYNPDGTAIFIPMPVMIVSGIVVETNIS